MSLDIRLPLGTMFALLGAIITVWGIVSPASIYRRSLGININLWWGLVLIVFGLLMLMMAVRAAGKPKAG